MMRLLALVVIFLSFPLFLWWLRNQPRQRHHALALIGVLLFFGGWRHIDASVVSWALWPSYARGILVSPIDTMALALILTRRQSLNRPPFLGLCALYAIPIIISLTVSAVPMATIFVLVQLCRVVLLYVAIAGEIPQERSLLGLMQGLSIGMMMQAAYVINQKLHGAVQAAGTMFHQNTLGMMTELAVLPLIAAILEGSRSWLNYAGVIAALIVIAGGGSRATMGLALASIVVLTALSVFRKVSARKMKFVGLGAACLAVIIPLGLMTLSERFGQSTMMGEEHLRKAFESAARAMARDHPLGVGANLYVNAANRQGYADRAGIGPEIGNRSAPVHNAYLLARAETGWAGEITYIVLLLLPALAGLRLAFANRRGYGEGVVLGSVIAILTISLHNNYEFAMLTYQPQALLFLNMAIIGGTIRNRRLTMIRRRQMEKTELIEKHHISSEQNQLI